MNEEYLNWLCHFLGILDISVHPNNILLRTLHDIEFKLSDPVIGHDENRISDAYSLRGDYLDENPDDDIPDIFVSGPSVFEVLVAFALRIDDDIMYDGNLRASKWFWEMISNLKMLDFTDDTLDISWDVRDVTSIVDVWMNRRYDFNGNGGIFPLRHSEYDQREIELWYQMGMYFEEIL